MSWQLREEVQTTQGVVAWDRVGNGPPVVLLHGTPWSSFVWRSVAERLSESYSVYVYDLPGFGRSEKRTGQDVSLASQGRVFGELLDAWNLDGVRVVAHDIGGAIALRQALLDGRRYTSLALLDPVALAPWGSPFYRLVRESTDVFEALPPHIHAAVVEAYIRSAFPRTPASDVLGSLVAPWVGGEGAAAFYRQIAQGSEQHTDEFRPRLSRLDCPTLIVWGESDPWIPVERGRELAGLIRQAVLRTIRGAGHLVQEDAPEEVLGHLVPFLDSA